MFPIRWNFPFRKKNGALSTIGAEIEGAGSYNLPTASSEIKGGIKIGSGFAMEGEVLNNTNPTPYSLPTAGADVLGGIKVGSRLTITDGVLSADAQLPASTSAEADKVLTVGSDGTPVWDTPGGGGGSRYTHYFHLSDGDYTGGTFHIVFAIESNSDTPIISDFTAVDSNTLQRVMDKISAALISDIGQKVFYFPINGFITYETQTYTPFAAFFSNQHVYQAALCVGRNLTYVQFPGNLTAQYCSEIII